MKRVLSIDIETYSSIDLIESGVYRYVEAEDFEILLFAYAFDNEPVECIALADLEFLPTKVMNALTDENILKTAFNANFERTCIAKHFNIDCDPAQWECTMVRSVSLGLPSSLAKVSKMLWSEEDKQKDKQGKALITYFSKPCKPTKVNGGRLRNLPDHDRDKWELFIKYCIQDVEVERNIRKELDRYGSYNEKEHALWVLDQEINDSGILLDKELIHNILTYNSVNSRELMQELKSLTGIENPNSDIQLKKWFAEYEGFLPASLDKAAVIELLEGNTISITARKVLLIRQELKKTSIKKYEAMKRSMCSDGKIRGILQFYGAARTGRWAGRIVQVHNLPQNKLKDIDRAREYIKDNNFEMVEMLWPSMSQILSQLIRTAFIAEREFIVADFSAIEARVIAWLADERWRQEVFATHGKIYEASASQMFKIPLDQITKDLRAKGKVSELALGYGGGPSALKQMGALDMGIAEEELPKLVRQWRNANKRITALWNTVENAALECVSTREPQKVGKGVSFYTKGKILFAKLPSGRSLAYYNPKLQEGTYGLELTYDGIESGKKVWGRNKTYGGKLVENIVQAIARDCLGELLIDLQSYNIKFHVHDEVILDVVEAEDLLEIILARMARPIAWAPGLQLAGAGFITKYYMKD